MSSPTPPAPGADKQPPPAKGAAADAPADQQPPGQQSTDAAPAGPRLSATDAAMLNEDWTKVAAWDVTDAAGAPVTTLDGLVEVLGAEDRTAAATELLASPASASAPAELLAEAKAEVNPNPAQESLFDDLVPADAATLPPAGGVDDTAPADPPADGAGPPAGGADDTADDGKPFPGAKAFPWQKGGKDKDSADTGSSTRKATIAAGAFVSGNFGKGKVEVVVTNGKVPGVDTDVTGTKDAPAARVRVYEESDGDWKATDKRVAVKASGLKTIPPLGAAKFGKKTGAAGLVLLVAEAGQITEGQRPSATAVRTVYERGTRAWPGEAKTELSREDWGLGRARAFLEKAAGIDTPGYVGDDDLLPS